MAAAVTEIIPEWVLDPAEEGAPELRDTWASPPSLVRTWGLETLVRQPGKEGTVLGASTGDLNGSREHKCICVVKALLEEKDTKMNKNMD